MVCEGDVYVYKYDVKQFIKHGGEPVDSYMIEKASEGLVVLRSLRTLKTKVVNRIEIELNYLKLTKELKEKLYE